MKVLVWGTGKCARSYLRTCELAEDEIIGFVESVPKECKMLDEFVGEKRVYAPDEMVNIEYDYVLVCVENEDYVEEIADKCNELGIMDERVVFIRTVRKRTETGRYIFYNRYQDNEKIKQKFPVLFIRIIARVENRYFSKIYTNRNICDDLYNTYLCRDEFLYCERDYFRYRTFEFVAYEIKHKAVEGNVAEVGVFQGSFAKLINKVFDDKKLYLFDTFEGFSIEEIESDSSICAKDNEWVNLHKDTSIENVLKIMPHRELCIVKKGYFPETAIGLDDERFAFVSVDVDLENSIYNCLEFFLPRVCRGGVMFVHDFNNYGLEGVKNAVYKYEEKYGRLAMIPIADNGGTLVIMK